MPCRGPDPDYGGEINKLTAMLCACCEALDKAKKPIPDSAKFWWREHQRWDAERRAQEAAEQKRRQVAEQAKKKLTPAERQALGLR
jgi:hypothetical protein